jgi:hypothetical protein
MYFVFFFDRDFFDSCLRVEDLIGVVSFEAARWLLRDFPVSKEAMLG